jgi:hypothetical protein
MRLQKEQLFSDRKKPFALSQQEAQKKPRQNSYPQTVSPSPLRLSALKQTKMKSKTRRLLQGAQEISNTNYTQQEKTLQKEKAEKQKKKTLKQE